MNTIGGNLIVKVKESCVAISKEMATKIMVTSLYSSGTYIAIFISLLNALL